jgi:imidazolonepropionase-like amidohydrolase
LIDTRNGKVLENQGILVEGAKIKMVGALKNLQVPGGAKVVDLSNATVSAELLEKPNDFGSIEVGKFADIIATTGDPLKDISELEHVKFVMKNGEIYKNEIAQK